MRKGGLKHMKYLKINDNKGYYLKVDGTNNEDWVEIDQISKDDLMNLLNRAILSDFEMDEYAEDLLGNKAHQIIYKNIYEKFIVLLTDKTRFKDESENLYKEAKRKYSIPG